MLKWILGIVALIVVVLFATCYAGYRRIAGDGNTPVTVTMPADSARTFALFTNRDSLLAWLPAGTSIMPANHGPLRAGDTVRVAAPTRGETPSARAMQLWVVREVKPSGVLVIEAIEFDTGGLPHIAFARRDSLVAMGDSTRVVSTFDIAPLLTGADSASASGRVSGSLLTAAERMRAGAARLIWEQQLSSLRHRMAP